MVLYERCVCLIGFDEDMVLEGFASLPDDKTFLEIRDFAVLCTDSVYVNIFQPKSQ